MIIQKLIDPIKQMEDSKLNDCIDLSYSLFTKEISNQNQINKIPKNYDVKIISNLVRFFRLINPSVKLDEEVIKEAFKGKQQSYNNITSKISEIIKSLSTRISFCDKFNSLQSKNFFFRDNSQSNPIINSIYDFVNLTWRIELVISNSNSNRVLLPIIHLNFYFSNGEQLKTTVSIKVFQELRKAMTYHIKRMIDNERVNLLK